jgi:hypothetical protein
MQYSICDTGKVFARERVRRHVRKERRGSQKRHVGGECGFGTRKAARSISSHCCQFGILFKETWRLV